MKYIIILVLIKAGSWGVPSEIISISQIGDFEFDNRAACQVLLEKTLDERGELLPLPNNATFALKCVIKNKRTLF
jgi:hypothetical protein